MVKQALSGLEGVVSVEDEWDRDPNVVQLEDLLFVTYDPERISEEQLMETIRRQDFEPKVQSTAGTSGNTGKD